MFNTIDNTFFSTITFHLASFSLFSILLPMFFHKQIETLLNHLFIQNVSFFYSIVWIAQLGKSWKLFLDSVE